MEFPVTFVLFVCLFVCFFFLGGGFIIATAKFVFSMSITDVACTNVLKWDFRFECTLLITYHVSNVDTDADLKQMQNDINVTVFRWHMKSGNASLQANIISVHTLSEI